MTLTLNDLLLDHSIMWLMNGSGLTNNYELGLTYDTDEDWMAVNEYTSYIGLFAFDSNIVNLSASRYLMMTDFNWPGNVTYRGYAGTFVAAMLLNSTQPASSTSQVSVKFRIGIIVGGGYNETSYVNLDVGKTYLLQMRFKREASAQNWPWFGVYEVDTDGNLGTLVAFINSTNRITIPSDPLPITSLSLKWYEYPEMQTLTWRFYEYDMIHSGLYDHMSHRIFGANKRLMDWTYNEPTNTKTYMMPPKPAFNGSAYDRAYVLEQQIGDLEDDIVSLQSDLDDANAAIAVLQSGTDDIQDELAEGGTFFDWLSGKVSDSAMLLSIGSTKLAHLKEVLLDPLGAIKTNIARLLVEKWNQNFEAPV